MIKSKQHCVSVEIRTFDEYIIFFSFLCHTVFISACK